MKRTVLVVVAAFAATSRADHRAVSVDVSAAWSVNAVAPAAPTVGPHTTLALGPTILLGGRYALTNAFEVSAGALFDVPVTVAHNGVSLMTPSGEFPGTLVHQTMRAGGLAGARLVLGLAWRFHLGIELGWSQRFNTGLVMYDDRDPANAVDYGLGLSDRSLGQFLISPLAGVEFQAGDHWSLSIMPRAQLMLGGGFVWAVMLPLQVSWNWFI